MNELKLIWEQEFAACLAAMYAVEKAFREDRERAFSIIDNSIYPAYVQQEASTIGPVAGYIGSGLQVLGKLFLRDDTPVYLPEKCTGTTAEEACATLKADLDLHYQAMLLYLNHIIRRMKPGDVSVGRCYSMLKRVADLQDGAAETIRKIGINEQIAFSAEADWCMERLEANAKARRRYQLIVKEAFYQQIIQKNELEIERMRETSLAALEVIVSALQQQEKRTLAREVKSLHSTVIQRYDDSYAMLREIRNQVKQSDGAVEICYHQICQVDAKYSSVATALMAMGVEMELYIRSTVRKLLESLGRDDQVMADMRDGVHGILYPTE